MIGNINFGRSAVGAAFARLGARRMKRPMLAAIVGAASALALLLGRGHPVVGISWDPHQLTCLPELHLAVLLHRVPDQIERNAYVFWRPSGALSYVREDYALKRVAGVPGDQLVIKDDNVYINGQKVVSGFEDAILYNKSAKDFERSVVIPADNYFVIGTAPMSNDSRYWGFLPKSAMSGVGYRVY